MQRKKKVYIMSNLQRNRCLKVDFQQVDKYTGGKWFNAARTTSCKAGNSPVEYHSWVSKCDLKSSDGAMWNSIFWQVQGQKDAARWDNAKCLVPEYCLKQIPVVTSIPVLVNLSYIYIHIYNQNSYNAYIRIDKYILTQSSGRKRIMQATGFGAYSSTCYW